MDALDCIKGRRSIRDYSSEDISIDTIKEIVETARFYPSWKNTQAVRFVAIKSDLKNEIANNATYGFEHNKVIINSCNTLMVIVTINGRSGYERDGSPTTSKGSHFQSFDAGLASEAFVLAAHEQGVGSVILGIYEEDKIKKLLSLGDDVSISCLIALGYPKGAAVAPKRKEVDEILTIM